MDLDTCPLGVCYLHYYCLSYFGIADCSSVHSRTYYGNCSYDTMKKTIVVADITVGLFAYLREAVINLRIATTLNSPLCTLSAIVTL